RLSKVIFPVCLTISWNIFVLLSVSNSNGEPNSTTRPASITKTLSESMTASVCGSTLAVASSITKIRFSRNIARAKQTNCLWPTLKLEPPSDILLCISHAYILITCIPDIISFIRRTRSSVRKAVRKRKTEVFLPKYACNGKKSIIIATPNNEETPIY
uniref:Uncharacterized protein n=1 Tax=Glossina palpalis gambiensis TaxID=67801 RepID=A0A1B0BLW3_9MUSC